MVEKQKLLKMTQTTGIPNSTAVVTAPATERNPPSPTSAITGRSGAAILAPIAAAGEKPIVARPPLVMNDCGIVVTSCWPAPFLFQPTSVTNTVFAGAIREISFNKRAG